MCRQRRIQVCPLRRIQTEHIVQGRVALVLNYRITIFPFHRQVSHKLRYPRCHPIRHPPFTLLWVHLPVYLKPLFPFRAYRAVSSLADRPIPPSGPMLLARQA